MVLAGGVQFSPAERDGAEEEVLPGSAVHAEGRHAPGSRPGGVAAGAAHVNALKDRLLASHQLTDIQKVELLVDMPALGDGKPTQLLAAMIEACPRGQEDSVFMSALFLRKLPADVKILLAHMDHTRLKELATSADQLVAMRAVPAAMAAVEADRRGGGGGEVEEEEAAGGAGAIQGGETSRGAVPRALAVWRPGLQLRW